MEDALQKHIDDKKINIIPHNNEPNVLEMYNMIHTLEENAIVIFINTRAKIINYEHFIRMMS